MRDCVVVGTGEYYTQIAGPSLRLLESESRLRVCALIDIHPGIAPGVEALFPSARYIRRDTDESLHEVLSRTAAKNPIVLLGHVNRLHVPDAADALAHGYDVLLEKPFFLGKEEGRVLRGLMRAHPGKIGLLEYYLTMKAAPLLYAAGLLRSDSFYFSHPSGIRRMNGNEEWFGKLQEWVGEPVRVSVDVLEGESATGRVDHRGIHLVDRRAGGGMIQDLGTHALAPLVALAPILGEISIHTGSTTVRCAWCSEYVAFAQKTWRLEEQHIGESFAQMDTITDKNVSVRVRVGKYTPQERNDRSLTIEGTRGSVVLDLSDCSLRKNGAIVAIFPKQKETKYYPVLRAALDTMQKENPFAFDPFAAAFRAQELVQAFTEQAQEYTKNSRAYRAGEDPDRIFA